VTSRTKRGKRAGRKWVGVLVAILVLVIGIRLVQAEQAGDKSPFAGTAQAHADTAWDDLFQNYGNLSGQWTGGDGAQALALPSGGTMWFFSDSYLGQVSAFGTRAQSSSGLAHNTGVYYSNGHLGPTYAQLPTIFGYVNESDYTWVSPPPPYATNQYELINGDQVIDDGIAYKFYQLADRGLHPGGFQYKLVGTVVESFWVGTGTVMLSPDAGTPVQVQDSASSDPIIWGVATLRAGGYIYIYGVKPYNGSSDPYPLYLARVPSGGLAAGDPWQYFDGTPDCSSSSSSAWTSSPQSAKTLRTGVSSGFSVTDVNGTYVLLTSDDSGASGDQSDAVAYYAKCPAGFSQEGPRYQVFDPKLASGYLAYEYRIVPQFSNGANVLVSYSLNTTNLTLNLTNSSIYRPRFLDVRLPGIKGKAGPVTDPP
jgi:Domain of unknown function (DUF5005)